jgi:hypothetical protein
MKQSFLTFCSVLALFMYSCTDVKQSDEYKKVVFDRDSLAESLSEREQDVLEFAKEFDLIEKNLSAIDTSRDKLLQMTRKGKLPQKAHIHALIADIYIAMDQNQSAINRLEEKVRAASESKGLKAVVVSLKTNLLAKEKEIELLKLALSKLQLEVKSLKDAVAFKEKQIAIKDTLLAAQGAQLQKQEMLIRQKEAEMNKAYFFKGTTKELLKAGIIKKEGGFAGLGTVKVLGDKLGTDKMKLLNIKNDKLILIGRYKKKKVITNHPADSYFFLAKDGQIYIKISFPDRFWSISKHLVVAVE